MAEKDKKEKDEEGGEAKAAAPAPSGGGKNKLLLIGGFVLLLLIVAGVPTAILLMRKDAKPVDEVAADAAQHEDSAALAPEGAGDEEELAEGEERLGSIVPLETFVVNLSGGRYLRAQIQLEFDANEVPTRFVSRLVPIRDGIILMLTKKTQADLETPKGKEELKAEVKNFVNELLHKEVVKRAYFTQFVIQ